MNLQEFATMIDPLDAIVVPYLADPNTDSTRKNDIRSRRDNINRILKELGDAVVRVKEDYKRRVQSEIDNINRIIQTP